VVTCRKLNAEKTKQDTENQRLQERVQILEAQNAAMEKVSPEPCQLIQCDDASFLTGSHGS